MSPLVIVAALAVASSAPLVLVLVSGGRLVGSGVNRKSVNRNLTSGLGPSVDARRLILAQPVRERAVRPAVGGLGERARRLTPQGVMRALEHRLQLADEPWRIEHVLVAKLAGWIWPDALVRSGPALGSGGSATTSPTASTSSRSASRQGSASTPPWSRWRAPAAGRWRPRSAGSCRMSSSACPGPTPWTG